MKKLVSLSVLLTLAAVGLGAGSITVKTPNHLDPWIWGKSYAITWDTSGSTGDTVRISLRYADSLAEARLIKNGAPNSGTYPWTVPSNITPGLYCLRVNVIGVKIQDDSDVFVIGSAAPSLVIVEPTNARHWARGGTYQFIWNNISPLPDKVVVDVLHNHSPGDPVSILWPASAQITNTGTFTWTVPPDIPLGVWQAKVYYFHALNVNAVGRYFQIVAAMPKPPVSEKK